MHEHLWAGVNSKLSHAHFHFREMDRALQPPERDTFGPMFGGHREVLFYASLHAFLSTTRSVPDIINCCFGVDHVMKDWFDRRSVDERDRRKAFKKQFHPHHDAFRKLPLSKARNVSVHRTGIVPVKATIDNRFGVTYTAEAWPGAANPIGLAGSPPAVLPSWKDFTIGKKCLRPRCERYLEAAAALVEKAHQISAKVHGAKKLSTPS